MGARYVYEGIQKPRLIQRGLQFLHMDLPDRLQHGDLVGPKKRYEFLAIEETTLENVSEEEITNLFGQTESTEQVQRLEVALEQLLPDERALILLFYWKEKTIEELVSITGLTASNIKVKLHRIRKKLFVLLNGMDHE